jgi:hypothetical protein
MLAYRIETTLQRDGLLTVDTLPLTKGERVEVIILALEKQAAKPVFLPFRMITMRGTGPAASEMVLQDRS